MTGERSSWLDVAWVGVLLAVALVVGGAFLLASGDETRRVEGAGLSAEVPAGWVVDPAEETLILRPALGSAAKVTITSVSDVTDPESAAFLAAQDHARSLLLFRVVRQGETAVAEQSGFETEYGFVDPVPDIPVGMVGTDVFWNSGGAVLSATLQAPVGEVGELRDDFREMLETVEVRP